MNKSQLYGAGLLGDPQTMNEEAAEASGPPQMAKSPALFWVAMAAVLIAVRMIYEYAE